MNRRKEQSSRQGIVASENLSTIFQREIFLHVADGELEAMSWQEIQDRLPSSTMFDFDPKDYLKFLVALEAEIFWLIYDRHKNQKDIADMLGLSQPTVSYRYRRSLEKLAYLVTLNSLDVQLTLNRVDFLKPREREILKDLFYYTNQEMVGKRHNVRQSSVKWILVKTKKRIRDLERKDPKRWFNTYGLFCLLETNLGIRVCNDGDGEPQTFTRPQAPHRESPRATEEELRGGALAMA